MERRCWINFQCRGVLLVWMTVGQGPIALAVGAGGGCLDTFSLIYLFSFLSPSLWETARYRLKYCLKGPLNPKQPTNQSTDSRRTVVSYLRWYVHSVLVNRLGVLSLPWNSLIRLIDHHDMTIAVTTFDALLFCKTNLFHLRTNMTIIWGALFYYYFSFNLLLKLSEF